MNTTSKYIYKAASGLVATGTCFFINCTVVPSTNAQGNVVLYHGTAATSGNEIARLKCGMTSSIGSRNMVRLNPAHPVECDGGLYVTITNAAAVNIELEG